MRPSHGTVNGFLFPRAGQRDQTLSRSCQEGKNSREQSPRPPQGLSKFDLGNESADLPPKRRLLRVDDRRSQSLLLLASSSEVTSAAPPDPPTTSPQLLICFRLESPVSRMNAKLIWCGRVALLKIYEAGFLLARRALAFQISRLEEERCISAAEGFWLS